MGLWAKLSEFAWLCDFGKFSHLFTPRLFSLRQLASYRKRTGTWEGGLRAGIRDFLTQLSGRDSQTMGWGARGKGCLSWEKELVGVDQNVTQTCGDQIPALPSFLRTLPPLPCLQNEILTWRDRCDVEDTKLCVVSENYPVGRACGDLLGPPPPGSRSVFILPPDPEYHTHPLYSHTVPQLHRWSLPSMMQPTSNGWSCPSAWPLEMTLLAP